MTAVDSITSIIPIVIFVVATVFIILSISMRGKSTAKVFNILLVVFSSICILFTATFSIMHFTGNAILSFSNQAGVIEGFNNEPTQPNYNETVSTGQDAESIYSAQVNRLTGLGYSDISMHMADVCDLMGTEAICCYKNGPKQMMEVYSIKDGYVTTIYTKDGSTSSLYLLELDGKIYLMDYSQSLSNDNYTQNYAYTIFRFDDYCNTVTKDQQSISVAANGTDGGSKGSAFFSKFNSYLASSRVCYDNYELKGYGSQNYSTNDFTSENKYLNITNCNTNKVGIVAIKNEKSWLNLRSGPSTKHDLVLIDPSDKKSYVKQSKNSLVTVIEPYNTNDSKNPIWYKVRISYGSYIIEGYSSQKYIKVENMERISKGKSFTVNISTNDTGARFSCNDTSIATIDPTTGTLKGKRAGIVLVTVTTNSGLTDSCLIEIK